MQFGHFHTRVDFVVAVAHRPIHHWIVDDNFVEAFVADNDFDDNSLVVVVDIGYSHSVVAADCILVAAAVHIVDYRSVAGIAAVVVDHTHLHCTVAVAVAYIVEAEVGARIAAAVERRDSVDIADAAVDIDTVVVAARSDSDSNYWRSDSSFEESAALERMQPNY